MQSDIFYTNDKHIKPIKVYFANEKEWSTQQEIYSAKELNCLKSQAFCGKLGEIGYLYNEKGAIDKVILGTIPENMSLSLAHAALKLPANTYYLDQAVPENAYITWCLAQYRFEDYVQKSIAPKRLVLSNEIMTKILPTVKAIFLTRDLINKPTNALGATEFATIVKDIARQENAHFEQWQGEALKKNFPAIYAVGNAAADGPRLLKLTWGDKNNPRIAIVGKGVCFDSGGLDLKPAAFMRYMKKDMGGAANALGLAQWIMQIQLPIYLELYIPVLENAVGSRSYRPGDVLIMRNGLTVEIDNTDAEGRLVLADAITFACEQKPELLIDFATLTGAARTAVGTEIAAMFCNEDKFAQELSEAALENEDPVWRLPLYSAYSSVLDSSIADMVNSGVSPYAGAITAGLFLQKFITPNLPWVHFDIMAWNVCSRPGRPEGGEAMGVRAVANYLIKRFGSH